MEVKISDLEGVWLKIKQNDVLTYDSLQALHNILPTGVVYNVSKLNVTLHEYSIINESCISMRS